MINANVKKVLCEMRESSKKYIRVHINGGKGMIALTDGNKMYLKKALLAEFKGDCPTYVFRFDVDKSDDISLSLILGVRKNKKLAFVAGHNGDVEIAGYVSCQSKKDDEDECDKVQENEVLSDKFFCGVFTTEHFTFILACSEKHPQMFYRELVRMDDQPDVQDIVYHLSKCIASKPAEVDHVQEE